MKFCVRPPKASSPAQSIVGRSTSTFGVCPALSVQISSGAPPSWKTRNVTPGSCGGGFCAWALCAAISANSVASRPAITWARAVRFRADDMRALP